MKWLVQILIATAFTSFVCPAIGHAQKDFASGQPWGLELGMGWGRAPESDYTRTLQDFGYVEDRRRDFRLSVAALRNIVRYFDVLLQANSLDRREYDRSAGIGLDDTFVFNTWGIGAHGRAWLPLASDRARAYLQAGIGPTVSVTRLRTRTDQSGLQTEFKQTQWFYYVAGLAGIEGLVGKHIGLYVQGGYIYAPTPKNRLDERHESGGPVVLAGLSIRFGGE